MLPLTQSQTVIEHDTSIGISGSIQKVPSFTGFFGSPEQLSIYESQPHISQIEMDELVLKSYHSNDSYNSNTSHDSPNMPVMHMQCFSDDHIEIYHRKHSRQLSDSLLAQTSLSNSYYSNGYGSQYNYNQKPSYTKPQYSEKNYDAHNTFTRMNTNTDITSKYKKRQSLLSKNRKNKLKYSLQPNLNHSQSDINKQRKHTKARKYDKYNRKSNKYKNKTTNQPKYKYKYKAKHQPKHKHTSSEIVLPMMHLKRTNTTNNIKISKACSPPAYFAKRKPGNPFVRGNKANEQYNYKPYNKQYNCKPYIEYNEYISSHPNLSYSSDSSYNDWFAHTSPIPVSYNNNNPFSPKNKHNKTQTSKHKSTGKLARKNPNNPFAKTRNMNRKQQKENTDSKLSNAFFLNYPIGFYEV